MAKPRALACIRCGREHSLDRYDRPCAACAAEGVACNLTVVYAHGEPTGLAPSARGPASLWRYADALPVGADEAVSLGEGMTPLLPAAALGARSMHSLSRRWLVFVPGGVVLHDHFTISAPTLIRRNQITSLRPAPAVRNKDDPPVRDLSAGAGGLVLELRLSSSAQIPLRGSRATEALEAMLLVPTRPKLALEVAAERKIPFG